MTIVTAIIIALVGLFGVAIGVGLGHYIGWHSRDLRIALLKEENARLKCMRSMDRLGHILKKIE